MKSSLVLLLLCALSIAGCSSQSEGADSEVVPASSTPSPSSSSTAVAENSSDEDESDQDDSDREDSDQATTTTSAAPDTTTTTTSEVGPAAVCGVAATVSFNESAPRDSMTIVNESTGDVSFTTVEFDLTSSAGGIIFDTLDGGAGVEVFQGFRTEAGDAVLAQDPVAEDGASNLSLEFDEFSAGQSFSFSIDVDDQLVDSDLGQIQVTGSEMAGAQVVLTIDEGTEVVAVFDDADTARVTSDC